MDIEAVKAEIDKMNRVQRTMAAVALLLAKAYRKKESIKQEQFTDVLKVGLETLANTATYEGKIHVLDVISKVAPMNSLPGEIGAVMLALLDGLDVMDNKLETAHRQMKNFMEMLSDAEKLQ